MSFNITQIPPHETWDLRHRVMWPEMPYDFVKLPEDDQGTHFGLYINERLVSIVSVFIANDVAQFRKLATETSIQGKGYGTKLLSHIIDHLEENKITKVWCNARADKTSFYEKFGLSITDQTFTKGGIDFVVMEKHIQK